MSPQPETPETAAERRDLERYLAAMAGVLTATRVETQLLGIVDAGADPANLRAGVLACLVDCSAVSRLLMARGIFTQADYFAAIADTAELELTTMTDKLRKLTNNPNLQFR